MRKNKKWERRLPNGTIMTEELRLKEVKELASVLGRELTLRDLAINRLLPDHLLPRTR